MKVAIVGASGYSGLELIRILLQHPKIEISNIYAHSQGAESFLEIYPHLQTILDLPLELLSSLTEHNLKKLREATELVFLAAPPGVSKEWGPIFLENGFKVIDLSGDFRLKESKVYEKWYGQKGASNTELSQAVYGLAEWFPEQIKAAKYIANPGCYATSILLALAPLFKQRLPIKSIIIDAKSGVSGAGRGFSRSTHYSEVNNSLKTYKVGVHQHIPEIEQTLAELSGENVTVQLMTHLIPMTRGILSTIYIDFAEQLDFKDILVLYHNAYKDQPFIRLRPEGEYPETKQVYGTNFCDIGFYFDNRTNRLVLFSVIDNLMKGAAGQAVQNLNLMMGWEQTLGLTYIPIYP